MSTVLPVEIVMPSWLAHGATEAQFVEGLTELQGGLENFSVFNAGTPEADVANFLTALFHPSRPIQFSPQDFRNLLTRLVEGRPTETARVFATAMMHARAQAGEGWVGPVQRRFAQHPKIPSAPAVQTAPAERVVVTRLTPAGHLNIKKYWASFSKHRGEEVAVRMVGDVVVGVDFLRDGPLSLRPHEESILIFQDGKLTDSIHHNIHPRRMAKLQNAVIKTRLTPSGRLNLGGRGWATFVQYGGYPVELEIRNGIIVEIRILKPSANLLSANEPAKDGLRELSLKFDKEGKLVHSTYGAKDLGTLTDHTVLTRLSSTGIFTAGGKARVSFSNHPGGIAAVRVKNGIIIQVLFLNAATIKEVDMAGLSEASPMVKEVRDYSLVYNEQGQRVASYLLLHAKDLSQLNAHTIVTRLNGHGGLTIGGKERPHFCDHPNGVIAVQMKDGVMVKAVLLRTARIKDVNPLSLQAKDIKREVELLLVWNLHGQLVDSFNSPQRIPVRLRKHLGKMTGNFRVDAFNGFLHGNKRYYFGDDVDYRGWPIPEIIFGDAKSPGEITEFVLSNPETGETIRLDARKYLQKRGDVAEWVVEKIPPAKGERAIGGKEPKGTLRIGPRAPNPEEEMIRAEQIARVRRALDRFTPEEMDLLLDVAMLYHELRRNTLPAGFHSLWLIEELENELDTLDIIARQLEVPREWIIRSFKKLKASLRD